MKLVIIAPKKSRFNQKVDHLSIKLALAIFIAGTENLSWNNFIVQKGKRRTPSGFSYTWYGG